VHISGQRAPNVPERERARVNRESEQKENGKRIEREQKENRKRIEREQKENRKRTERE
jgi:hypothetical protein